MTNKKIPIHELIKNENLIIKLLNKIKIKNKLLIDKNNRQEPLVLIENIQESYTESKEKHYFVYEATELFKYMGENNLIFVYDDNLVIIDKQPNGDYTLNNMVELETYIPNYHQSITEYFKSDNYPF